MSTTLLHAEAIADLVGVAPTVAADAAEAVKPVPSAIMGAGR